MQITQRIIRTALLFVIASLPVHAQYGPGTLPRPQPDQGGANNPAPAAQQMQVPDYIKPGFQMLYMSASSTESAQPDKVGSAGMGFTEYTIVAVTNDKVLVTATNYLAPNGVQFTQQGEVDPNADHKVQLIGSNSYAITANDVLAGNAMWMPVDQLKQWQSGNGVEVQRGPWPYQGQQVNAAIITAKGNDYISSNTFNTDNGQKLGSRSASGNMRRNDTGNNPYNRVSQAQMQLVSTRQVDSPLINAKWPNWAKTVKKMHYKGTYSMAIPGGGPVPPVQMAMEIEYTERGEDYLVGKSTLQVQGNQPTTNPVVQGPGSAMGNWIHPDILANLQQGKIDRNQILRTTTTYQVQQGNLGQLGVFVRTNDAQTFYTVSGYNLDNGALTYVSLHTADTNTTIEFTLDGIEAQ